MLEISLEALEFYAYHGHYEKERIEGNKFFVDVKAVIPYEKSADLNVLDNTVDYEVLYAIIREHMEKTSLLLENVASGILEQITMVYPGLISAEVSISKLNPPIGGRCERARVTVRKEAV
jgi:7,8-dihydroneopterin aldolase/epimerase/oxygenase